MHKDVLLRSGDCAFPASDPITKLHLQQLRRTGFRLPDHGKSEFYDLDTAVFKNGGFLKGNTEIADNMHTVGHTSYQESSFEGALQARAKDSVVVLSIVDSRYAKFALNLYKTSLEKFDINYLMVCIDEESFKSLTRSGLHCVLYKTNITDSSGDFGSLGYIQKTNLKTWIVLHALRLGYTVLVSDLDVVMFKNPFPFFSCEDCDLHVTRDRVQFNTGFIYVRPTFYSKYLYQVAWDLYKQYYKASDQSYFNSALKVLENERIKISIKELPQTTFQCGVFYFQDGGREFAGKPCADCVMVHNNYLGSLTAKIYRFKENLLWKDDTDQYYSSLSAKYLTYDNPYFFADKTWENEIFALKTALAIAASLNRIVILPKFHCCQCDKERCENKRHRCSMLSLLNIKTFDAEFNGKYREHVFLQNPLVPLKYKEVQSKKRIFVIKTQTYDNREDILNNSGVQVIVPKSASMREVTDYLQSFSDDNVLDFHSLYGLSLLEEDGQGSIPTRADVSDNAFKCINYEQWEDETQ